MTWINLFTVVGGLVCGVLAFSVIVVGVILLDKYLSNFLLYCVTKEYLILPYSLWKISRFHLDKAVKLKKAIPRFDEYGWIKYRKFIAYKIYVPYLEYRIKKLQNKKR